MQKKLESWDPLILPAISGSNIQPIFFELNVPYHKNWNVWSRLLQVKVVDILQKNETFI